MTHRLEHPSLFATSFSPLFRLGLERRTQANRAHTAPVPASEDGMRGHQSSDAEAYPVASQRRLKTPWLVRGAIAATALVTLTASSSSPPLEVAGRRAAFADAPMFTRLRTPGMGWSGRGGYGWPRQARCAASPRMVARGTPEKGEVRNPWGRAGKPETRIMRQQEAEQVAELRAQAWSQALRRSPGAKGRSANKGDGEVNADGLDVSITEDIKDFHERACSLLRENGGRMVRRHG